MGADCNTNRDTCTILPYLDEVAITAHKHYNPPPSAVQPSTPLRYTVTYYAGSVEQVMDVKVQISFSLTANFNPGLPTSFVPGQQQALVPSFSVSSTGPSSVRDGYCVVSLTPLSVLDRSRSPSSCGDGPDGTLRCNFQNTNLLPGSTENFALPLLPFGPTMRDNVTVAVPVCNNNAGSQLSQYTAPTPLSMSPHPDIQLSLALLDSDSLIIPGHSTGIRFKLSNTGLSTSMGTTLFWSFPLDINIMDDTFTQAFCKSNALPDRRELNCALDVKAGEEEHQLQVQLAFASTLSAVDFSVKVKDEVQKETIANGKLMVSVVNLTAGFTKNLPAFFVPGGQARAVSAFNISNSGPALVQEGYCLVSFSPLSMLDRAALPSTCADGPKGTIQCNFQSLSPAAPASFALQTLPLGPEMREKISVSVPLCNNTANDLQVKYFAPQPQSSQPSPDIHLAFAFIYDPTVLIQPDRPFAISFKLSNTGLSTSLNTNTTWLFPFGLTILDNLFTQSFCHMSNTSFFQVVQCAMDVNAGEDVEDNILVSVASSSPLAIVNFSVHITDELKNELSTTSGQLKVSTFSKNVLMHVEFLSLSVQLEDDKRHDFAMDIKSAGPSWALQVGCFFNFTALPDGSSLLNTTFSSSLPDQACTILTNTSIANHVLCQVGDLSTIAWTSFRFGLSSRAPLHTTLQIGCQSITPNNFPWVSWSAVIADGVAQPTIDPGADNTTSQFPNNTPNLQLVPKEGPEPQDHLRLDFTFHSINEVDAKGHVLRNITLPSSGYQSTYLDKRTIRFMLDLAEADGRKRVEWTFTVVEEDRDFHVGNTSYKVASGFNKWSVNISGWLPSPSAASASGPSSLAATAPHNHLHQMEKRWLELKVSMKSLDGALKPRRPQHNIVSKHEEEHRGVLNRGLWHTEHTTVMLGLLQVCVVDGEQQAAYAKVEQAAGKHGQWLLIRLPVGQNMFYDPDVQVLVDGKGSGHERLNVKLVVVISVGVTVAVCVVGMVVSGAVVWRRRKMEEFSASLGAVNFSGEEDLLPREAGGAEYVPLVDESDWQD
ncbi:hypothetical protein QOT17_017714 [Balamuthia mandrillaris]